MNFKFSNHALEEMEKRKVPISFVEAVLDNPQQTLQQDKEITREHPRMDMSNNTQELE